MSSVQPTSSQSFNWEQMDTKVAAASAQGLQVLGILDYAPPWNAQPGCAAGPRKACAPADSHAFANFAAAAAARFPQVTYWEIWNEPNLVRFWSPSPSSTDYIIMLNAAYAAIKAVAPHDVVVAGASLEPVTFPVLKLRQQPSSRRCTLMERNSIFYRCILIPILSRLTRRIAAMVGPISRRSARQWSPMGI